MKSRQNQYILANQIIDLIQTLRLRAGHHLTEQFLAAELKVSRTPVRSALSLLAKERIVVARTNQGFFLAKAWAETEHVSIAVPTTPDQDVYAAMVSDRLHGNIPATVTQKELEERYKVNRSILLRALSRMADEGLIDRNRGRGWTFRPTLDNNLALRDSYNFRLAVEPSAFGMATFAVDTVTLKRSRADHEFALMGKTVQDLTPIHLFNLDSDFHEMIAGFSHNSFLIHAIQQQNRLRRLLEFQTYTSFRRVREWLREHLAIIEALDKSDLAGAADAMRRHLRNAAEASNSQVRNNKSGASSSQRQAAGRKRQRI